MPALPLRWSSRHGVLAIAIFRVMRSLPQLCVRSTEGWESGNCAQAWSATSCTPRVQGEMSFCGYRLAFGKSISYELVPMPLLTKPLCGRGLVTGLVLRIRGQGNYTLRMRKPCVPGPLPTLLEGPGYGASSTSEIHCVWILPAVSIQH